MKRDELPADAPSTGTTLRTIALAALHDLLPAEQIGHPLAPFVRAAYQRCGGPAWPQVLAAALRSPADPDRRLARLAQRLDLDTAQTLALVIALQADIDPAIARLLEWLQAPLGGMRPTLGLLAAVAAALDSEADVVRLRHGQAMRLGALTIAPPHDVPLAATAVQVPDMLLQLLTTTAPSRKLTAAAPCPSQQAQLEAALHTLSAGNAVVLRSADPDEARLACDWLAQRLGRRVVRLTQPSWPAGLVAAATLGELLPVFELQAAPGEQLRIEPPGIEGVASVVACGSDGSVRVDGAALELRLALPLPDERMQRWRGHGLDAGAAQQLARRWRCSAVRIDSLAATARLRAAANGVAAPREEDLAAAVFDEEVALFDGVGSPLRGVVADDDLIVADPVTVELQRLLARCRIREELPPTAYGASGVRALFVGPSGTGKSLAARWLAQRLAVPLVAVDLAALTSKWVGETEKNLAQVFDRAERSCSVLLFDEADSVFGARTDVGSANDRFANNQTNYLLGRIERFDGVVVLTSNSRARIDPGFLRRLDLVVDFGMPGPTERRRLWKLHLGDALAPDERDCLAGVIDLPGGNVAAAALAARASALYEGRGVDRADLVAALRAEYAKLGRSMPAELSQ